MASLLRIISAAPPSVVSTRNRFIETAARTLEAVFGQKTVYVRCGGSIPVAGLFHKPLKALVMMMGLGLCDDRLHAPNEKFHLPNFYRGIECVARYMELLGVP